ncbi:MAG: hypothetical protein AMXMBFR83_19990 [Phycisphaerae bacterium]
MDFSPRGPVVFDGPCASASAARPWLPDRLDVLVPELMARHKVPGVSIVGIEDRRISWERQYGARSAEGGAPVDSQTVFEAASMTKLPFTCVVLKLVEEGKLDLDRPLADYLDQPYMPYEPRHRLITARMVLAHHSGMPNWRKGGWRAGGPIELIADPGTKYTYSGEGYLYLQRVVEHVTGTPFERLMKERLFDPLGLTLSNHVWEERYERLAAAGHDEDGKVKPDRRLYTEGNAAYSLYCTPAEYAALIVDLLRLDRSAPHALSAGSLAAMFRRTFRVEGSKPILRCGVRHADYSDRGLGWVIDETASGDRMHHSGSNGTGFRCYCEFDPVKGNGLVIMTNAVGGQALWRDLMAAAGDP